VAELPQCVPETLGQTCPLELQPQHRLVPSLTLGYVSHLSASIFFLAKNNEIKWKF